MTDPAFTPPPAAYSQGSTVVEVEPAGTIVAGEPFPILGAHV